MNRRYLYFTVFAAGMTTLAIEFAASRLLGSVLTDKRSRWDFALDTYSAVRPLSDRERGLVRILDLSSVLLSPLHWVELFRSLPSEVDMKDASRGLLRAHTLGERLKELAENIDGI